MPSAYSLGINAHELILPSTNPETGEPNKCRVRRIAPQQLIAMGILNNLDSLGALVKEAHLDRVNPKSPSGSAWKDPGAKPEDAAEGVLDDEQRQTLEFITKNSGRLYETLEAIDKIVEIALLEPPIKRPVKKERLQARGGVDGKESFVEREQPLESHERDPNVLYTDMVDQDDKNAIMNFAISGVKAMEPFRQGRHADVVDLPAGEGIQHDPQRSAEPGLPAGSVLPGPGGTYLRDDAGERLGGSREAWKV